MRIRTKLFILLMVAALLPGTLIALFHRSAMLQLGHGLAGGVRKAQTGSATDLLRRTVFDYGTIIRRDRAALETAVRFQAREVERLLASPPPADARVFLNDDYADGGRPPADVRRSEQHFRTDDAGARVPIDVSYAEQVYFVVDGLSPRALADDMARLSSMPEVYAFARRSLGDLAYWQYTSLEAGFHTSYPGHGGYPADYDPRTREWYVRARDHGDLTWLVMPEVSSRTVTQTVAMPVRGPDGRFAGVTAIDVPFGSLFHALRLPAAWAAQAETMLAVLDGAGGEDGRAQVLVHRDYERQGRNWQTPLELLYLESDQPARLQDMLRTSRESGAAVARMDYRGVDSLWACGPAIPGRPFPVVVVPHDLIVAEAAQAEGVALARTDRALWGAGLLLAGVGVLAGAIALIASRAISGPIRQLAGAAEKLAEGDYDASVAIGTGDELQELGEVFNSMGPRLRDYSKVKHSLELAMQIQQNLLPRQAPQVEGFEVYGQTRYCDETGGDYFDFIDLAPMGLKALGLVVGDVSGHGIPAALLMASARSVFRVHAGSSPREPAAAIRALNRSLVHDTMAESFMTLFYALVDIPERTLHWTTAGHDPAILIRRAGGRTEQLGSPALPAGLFEEADYTSSGPVRMESGDVMIIGTDGIWEARDPEDNLYGHERLHATLAACREASAEGIFEAIMESVTEFSAGRPAEDDITLVVLKAL
ncbi:MAG: SpoIIE family protein phosphatase [Candidatus Brocadiaceae bacterium]|nr:SpoIIE family protein phosphatase [Candidatus Brocadiaceae bacterium]